jgi:cytoskeletal protein CcmA (bactofilin family)
MPSRIQLRRDTAANWTSINPVLALGEPGLDTDIDLLKYGDGVTAWNDLPYSGSNPSAVGNIIPALGNTYTLGNATNAWQSLYVSGNTIYLGNIELGENGAGEFTVDGVPIPVLGGNVTFENISATGNVTVDGTINANSDVNIAGNLTVTGNATYENVTSFNVQDPIIGLGRAANNQPLVSNDGKDRGEQLWYYTSSEKSAFIGLDNSAGKLTAAVDVTIANEIVTVNNLGNFVAGNVESTTVSSTGNVTGGNIITAGAVSAASVSASGTVTAASIVTGGAISTTGNISGNNITATNLVSAATVSVSGNVTANYFVGDGSALTSTMTDRGSDLNNWNSMTQMGVYTVNRASWAGTSNTPLDSQVFVGLVEVLNSTGTALTQVYFPGTVEPGNVKVQWNRTYWGGSWSSWIKIINDDQVVTGGSY